MAVVEDFERLDIRIGTIVSVDDFPSARKPAYQLTIDFGVLGHRRSSAQITVLYDRESLVGRQVVAVVNFPPRRIAGFLSEVLVLGATQDDGRVILLQPEREARPGDLVK